MVLLIGAGIIGLIGVVVTYRRQKGLEEGQFLQELGDAGRQLGDQNPTIQAVGIYSLAGLADRSPLERRQQCINVLCAYIRLPYNPAGLPDTTEKIVRTTTLQNGMSAGESIECTTTLRPHDRITRETIVRVIAQHLRKNSKVSWSKLHFDFTGATFDYGDFSDTIFKGHVRFVKAQFIGGTIDFRRIELPIVQFPPVEFNGGILDFRWAKFNGGTVTFRNAQLSSGFLNFWSAEFNGGTVDFREAKFDGSDVRFWYSEFNGGIVDFREAAFNDSRITYQEVEFNGGIVDFKGAAFKNGTLTFQEGEFNGGIVKGADFNGSTIDFSIPRDWTTPPKVPWRDGEETPAGVVPDAWPPRTY
jgi:uncharacterized protein YjbI with pentapeptide repeats